MGIETLAAFALTAVQTVSSIRGAQQQAEAADKEAARQQGEANLQAQSEKSDRQAQADRELSSMLVAFEAAGGAGSANVTRAAGDIGGVAGLDLARIEANRRNRVASLQSEKKSAAQKAKASITGALVSGAGQAFSIAGKEDLFAADKEISSGFVDTRGGGGSRGFTDLSRSAPGRLNFGPR